MNKVWLVFWLAKIAIKKERQPSRKKESCPPDFSIKFRNRLNFVHFDFGYNFKF